MTKTLYLLGSMVLFYSSIARAQGDNNVSVAFTLDHYRIIVPVEIYSGSGKLRRAKAWLDNGTPAMSVAGGLAAELGLFITTDSAGDHVGKRSKASIAVGGMRMPIAGIPIEVTDAASVGSGMDAEITLPASLLSRYDLVVDYPGKKLILGQPGSIHFQGTAVKAFIHPKNALIQLPATMDGGNFQIALDLGTPVSLVADSLIKEWGLAHPSWPTVTGAIGIANLWGLDTEPQWRLLRIHHLLFGGIDLPSLVAATCPPDWLDYFRKRVGMPTVGLIGAEALDHFCIGIDYAHRTIYFQQRQIAVSANFDCIGLTLKPQEDGNYRVLGVTDGNGQVAIPGIIRGDTLLTIDDHPVRGLTMGEVWSLLSGTPGATCKLTVGRAGTIVPVSAKIDHFLPD